MWYKNFDMKSSNLTLLTVVKVKESRNLIIEDSFASKAGCQFVPNDIELSSGKALVLTGPNMGGKSCYLRQVGMLLILAQMGSFVPALEASMPIFDALFVRLGAKDEIGRSNFSFKISPLDGNCQNVSWIFVFSNLS